MEACLLASQSSPTADEAVALVPRTLAFRLDALPLACEDGVLTVGMPDPSASGALDELRIATRLAIRPVALARREIRERLRIVYGEVAATPIQGDDPSAIGAADRIFLRAVASHASDVHIEPAERGGRIRYRVDGLLREVDQVTPDAYAPLISRIKLSDFWVQRHVPDRFESARRLDAPASRRGYDRARRFVLRYRLGDDHEVSDPRRYPGTRDVLSQQRAHA